MLEAWADRALRGVDTRADGHAALGLGVVS